MYRVCGCPDTGPLNWVMVCEHFGGCAGLFVEIMARVIVCGVSPKSVKLMRRMFSISGKIMMCKKCSAMNSNV